MQLTLFDANQHRLPAKVQPAAPAPQSFEDRADRHGVVYAGLAVRDLPTQAMEEFRSPDEVRRVLRMHAEGNFSRSAYLWEAMLADDRVAGCLDTRVAGLQGLPFEMQPAGGRRPNRRKAKAVAKHAEEIWKSGFPLEDRVNLLRWGYGIGVGVGQLRYLRSANEWKPSLEVWHGSFVYWDWTTRSYWVQTEQGPVEVDPGNGQWVVFTPYGYERGWMDGLVRRLSVPFSMRLFGSRDLARASEVSGNPSRIGKYPRTAPKEEREAFIKGLAMLTTDAVVGLPVEPGEQGLGDGSTEAVPQYDVSLLESAGRNWQVFDLLLKRADTDIAVAILGQNLTTQVEGGSFAAASVHGQVKQDYIKRDGIQAQEFFFAQVLKPWTVIHYGDSALTPQPVWDTRPPEDQKARAETLAKVGEAVESLERKGRFVVDRQEIADSFRLPLLLGKDGEGLTRPAKMTDADLKSGSVQRDEHRESLGLKPLGGKRGKELLGAATSEVPVPPKAQQKEGPQAEATLLTLLSLSKGALAQLATGTPYLKGEARWFARAHDVGAWAPAARAELARRGLAAPEAPEVSTQAGPTAPGAEVPQPVRDALAFVEEVEAAQAGPAQGVVNPLLKRVMETVASATSYEDLREKLVALYASTETQMTEEALADRLVDAQSLARLMGNLSALEEQDERDTPKP